jgi:hypothetical protein
LKREVRRDLFEGCRHNYETINNAGVKEEERRTENPPLIQQKMKGSL